MCCSLILKHSLVSSGIPVRISTRIVKWNPYNCIQFKLKCNCWRWGMQEDCIMVVWRILKILSHEMSCRMTKPTKIPVRPAKTLIRLGICPVWSESSLSALINIEPLITYGVHSEDWSDWVDAQADLSLRWVHMFLLVLLCGSSELW